LQQTQVSRVAEYYPRFIERFPDLATLANAKPRAVREAWDGLGYYARASNLHALAKSVVGRGVVESGVAEKGVAGDGVATLPDDPEELIKLPGVGRYTAGAVACFAYERPVPAVDTNVARVIARVFIGMRDAGSGMRPRTHPSRISHPASRRISELARALVPRDGKRAWRFNQAMMELGALVCTARRPKCGECPVQQACRTGRRLGRR